MPFIGQIKKGTEIGFKSHKKCIWYACIVCGKERWVQLYKGTPKRLKCKQCASLKGKPVDDGQGYLMIKLRPDDFFYSMTKGSGYVLEHRLVMAKHLGRNLHPWELVHHKEGVAKDDNRIKGLQLVSDDRHRQITILENRIHRLEARVTQLEAENVRLENELNKSIGTIF